MDPTGPNRCWTAEQTLKISEQTVNNHLRNACQELEVTSKHIAVLMANTLRLLCQHPANSC